LRGVFLNFVTRVTTFFLFLAILGIFDISLTEKCHSNGWNGKLFKFWDVWNI